MSDGTVGELDHRILLKQYGGPIDLAEKWRGGRYRLVEQKQKEYTILSYAVAWEDVESARRYFTFYAKVMCEKTNQCVIDSQTGARVMGHSSRGYGVPSRRE